MFRFCTLFILFFSQFCFGAQKTVVSIGLDDEAFDAESYRLEEKFYAEQFPDYSYVRIPLGRSRSANISKIKQRLSRLPLDHTIHTVVINSHGMNSWFVGLGSFDENGTSDSFQKIIQLLADRMDPNSKIIFNSCYALCGDDTLAIEKAKVLRSAFQEKVNFVYASQTAETFVYHQFYSIPQKEASLQDYLNHLKLRLSDLRTGKLGILFAFSVASFGILKMDLNHFVHGFLMGTAGGLGWMVIQRIQQKIKDLHVATLASTQFGDNKGRAFFFDSKTVTIESIDRNTQEGILKSHGLRTCDSML